MTTLIDALPVQAPAKARSITWEKAWWVPLAVILAVQAYLIGRLVGVGYASDDEGRYIWAGHQLIYEFWHGGGSPYFETYYSGAPVIYSPLAAMADYVGGLAAVRLMSAVFMLTATCLLYLTVKRLFSYWPAIFATGLYAGLRLSQVVGRNAIYDAMALMLLAAAAYCATRTGAGERSRWLLLVPAFLLAANATKYVTLIFDPAVIVLAAFQVRDAGGRAVVKRTIILGCTTVAALTLMAFLAGTSYLKGVLFTTLTRKTGSNVLLGAFPTDRHVILTEAWHWFGLVVILSFAAVLIAWVVPRERSRAWLLLACAGSGVLVTLEAVHLHSDQSMGRHDAFCAWFACIAAGYVLWLPSSLTVRAPVRSVLIALGIGAVAASGFLYSVGPHVFNNHGSGYNTEDALTIPRLYPKVRPYLEHGGAFLLAGTDLYEMVYNDHISVHWWNLIDDNYIKYPIPGRGGDLHGQAQGRACWSVHPACMYLEGGAAYREAIRAHAFAVVSITRPPDRLLPQDRIIEATVRATPGYVLLTTLDGGPTWIYAPAYRNLAHTVAAHRPVHPAVPPQHGRVSATALIYAADALAMPSLIFAFAGIAFVTYVLWRRERLADGTRMPAWAWAYFLAIAGGAAVAACVPNRWERSRRGAGP